MDIQRYINSASVSLPRHSSSKFEVMLTLSMAYTLFQNGRHLSILLFPSKLALMASFKVKYSIEFYV